MAAGVINRGLIDNITEAKLAEGRSSAMGTVVGPGADDPAELCARWEWLDKAPPIRMLPKATRRIRLLTRERAAKLIDALPEHLVGLTLFSLCTGLQSATQQASAVARVHADQAKGRFSASCFVPEDVIAAPWIWPIIGYSAESASMRARSSTSPPAMPKKSDYGSSVLRAAGQIRTMEEHDVVASRERACATFKPTKRAPPVMRTDIRPRLRRAAYLRLREAVFECLYQKQLKRDARARRRARG